MQKQLIRNFVVALLAATSVYAQGSQRLTVKVPFEFHVGPSMLPAGTYIVDNDAAPNVVRLKSLESKASVMIQANFVQTMARTEKGKLVFNRYGDDYFLSQIWKAGSNVGSQLRKTRRETEVAASARRGPQSVMASNE